MSREVVVLSAGEDGNRMPAEPVNGYSPKALLSGDNARKRDTA